MLSYISFVVLVHGFLVVLDKVLVPSKRNAVINYFEDHWYRNIDSVRIPRFRKMAGSVADALSRFVEYKNIGRFLLLTGVMSFIFFLLSQILQFGYFYAKSPDVLDSQIPMLFYSFWLWTFPIALISNFFLFYCSIYVTSHLLNHVSKGDLFDAVFLPLFDIAFAVLLFLLAILCIQLTPLLYGVGANELALEFTGSQFENFYLFIYDAVSMSKLFGAGLFGSAFLLFVPTLIIYCIYIGFLVVSLADYIFNKVFSYAAELNAYSKVGEQPFTCLAYLVSASALLLKITHLAFQ